MRSTFTTTSCRLSRRWDRSQATAGEVRNLAAPPEGAMSMKPSPLTTARARALAQVAFLAALIGVQHVCYAYPGEQFLDFLGTFIIGPVGLIAIVVALVASMLRPEFVKQALWAAVICIAVFFVIREGDTIINLMRSSGG